MKINNLINVASFSLGSEVIDRSDDFFAEANRMLQDNEAVFIEDKYDENGKWMDGWETRRRRDGENDFCVIKLGCKSIINNFDIDTSYFTGNYAPGISILAYCSEDDDKVINQEIQGFELLTPKDLTGDSHNCFESISNKKTTHLRITIYPDGGIARFRAFGEICFDDSWYLQENINVASLKTGAKAIYANDEHFGKLSNILLDTESKSMADGWETRRRRRPGNDYGIIQLARPAIVDEIVVDTSFFKGNYPDSFSICATDSKNTNPKSLLTQSMFWQELIAPQKLKMNQKHIFAKDKLLQKQVITHIRLNIFPDGGIARLKLNGKFVKL